MTRKELLLTAGISLQILTGCSCDDGPVDPPPDTTPPTVVSTDPANNAADVDVDSDITIVFSEAIKSSSVTTSSIMVSGGISYTVGAADSTVVVTPSAPLPYFTQIMVTVTTDVTDLAGNGFAQDTAFVFSTEQDPALLPPVVTGTWPGSGAQNQSVNSIIKATFSKPMDAATITASSFQVAGVTGAVSFANDTAYFMPDDPLDYETDYSCRLTTSVTDSGGMAMATDYNWAFRTGKLAEFLLPFDRAICGDTCPIVVQEAGPDPIDHVELQITGMSPIMLNSSPFGFEYDVSALPIATEREITAIATDANGVDDVLGPITVIVKWELLLDDDDDRPEGQERNIRRIYTRSAGTDVHFRVEFYGNWTDLHDVDSGINMVMFIDNDQSAATGARTFLNAPEFGGPRDINDIGADRRIIIGRDGDSVAVWQTGTESWLTLSTPGLFEYRIVPMDTNVYEIGISSSTLNSSQFDVLFVNFFYAGGGFALDWAPDSAMGHETVLIDSRYIGPVPGSTSLSQRRPPSHPAPAARKSNPFD